MGFNSVQDKTIKKKCICKLQEKNNIFKWSESSWWRIAFWSNEYKYLPQPQNENFIILRLEKIPFSMILMDWQQNL